MCGRAAQVFNVSADFIASEAELIAAAQKDRAAFSSLYDHYVDRVYGYVRARTTIEEDAADLTQQIFIQALQALPKYKIQSTPFASWLFRIARNTVIDAQRRQKVTVAWDLIPEALQPVDSQNLETTALVQEDIDHLRALLRGLSTDTRELLALRFSAELTMSEIAKVLGKSEEAIKKRVMRALRDLKEKYYETAC